MAVQFVTFTLLIAVNKVIESPLCADLNSLDAR